MTPNIKVLEDLLGRLEAAGGPDRDLDTDLAFHFSKEFGKHAPFTSTLDSALALVERVLPGTLWELYRIKAGGFMANLPDVDSGFGPTPALALLTALVRALISNADSAGPQDEGGRSSSVAQSDAQSAPVTEAAALMERARYRIGNPSAWDHYDDGASELLRDLVAALNPPPQGSRGWRPIETAPRTVDGAAAEGVILGFAPDETGYSPASREGFWNPDLNRWSSTLDPSWSDSPQPTHWQPLPAPPLEVGEDIVASSATRLDASCAPPESGGQAGGGEP